MRGTKPQERVSEEETDNDMSIDNNNLLLMSDIKGL